MAWLKQTILHSKPQPEQQLLYGKRLWCRVREMRVLSRSKVTTRASNELFTGKDPSNPRSSIQLCAPRIRAEFHQLFFDHPINTRELHEHTRHPFTPFEHNPCAHNSRPTSCCSISLSRPHLLRLLPRQRTTKLPHKHNSCLAAQTLRFLFFFPRTTAYGHRCR